MPRRNPPASTRRIGRRADDLTRTTASRTTGSSGSTRVRLTPEEYNRSKGSWKDVRGIFDNGQLIGYEARRGT